jgi:ABC-2 type transport system permease protein
MKHTLGIFRAFFMRDFTTATSYPLEFLLRIATAIFPLFVLYLPAKLLGNVESTREYGGFLPFSVIGIGVMNFFMASYGSFASAIRSEQSMGTLESVLMTPVSVPVLVLASSTWAFAWSTITAVLFIGGGALLYGIALQGSWALALVFVVLTTLVFIALGVLSASFIMVWKRGDPIGPIVSIMFFLLGGVVYPTSVLPTWLGAFAWLLPITHASAGIRDVLIKGAGVSAVSLHLGVLVGYAVLMMPLSLFAFQRAVKRATRDGTLLQF